MELVTGKAGVPHVSSADDGRRIAGEVGAGGYVLQTGGRLAPSLVDANTVRFATGDMIVQGRHIGLTAPEDVKVASGTQGKKRTDYICVHYKRDVSGANPTLVETVEWTVLQGTPGTDAAAPSVPAGSILAGDADVTVPVCSVSFDGLTTGEPKLLIGELTPLAALGDSVSRAVLLLSEDLTVPGGKMRVEVYDMPAIRELVMRFSGNIRSAGKFFTDYYTTGKIPKDKLPSTPVNCALAQYEGTWGRFCARGCILDDGRASLSLISPQAIQTGYTSECRISYAF